MKAKDIITLPNPHLRKRSTKVGLIDETVQKIINDMRSATLDWEDHREHELGVALAAVQIDELKKIIIVRNNFEDKNDQSFQVFINPEITKYLGDVEEDYEGCLSIKDIYGKVPRYNKIKIKALDENGQLFRLTVEGFLARVLQHEIDHTKGVVFIDHIKDKPKAFFRLTGEGNLEPLNYIKDIKNNHSLWEN